MVDYLNNNKIIQMVFWIIQIFSWHFSINLVKIMLIDSQTGYAYLQ